MIDSDSESNKRLPVLCHGVLDLFFYYNLNLNIIVSSVRGGSESKVDDLGIKGPPT